jgi:hypothetical protein
MDRGYRTNWQTVVRGENPKNPTSKLYKRLTRIFSGPITRYQRQTPRKEKRRHLDKYSFDSAMGQPFLRQSYNPFSILRSNTMAEASRVDRYVDFELMEFTPIIAAALDTYADEMTTKSPMEDLLVIKSQNEEIKSIVHELFYNILNIEHNLHGWCRSMLKYGDFFLYLDLEEGRGVRNIIGLPVTEVERLEGLDETNPYYVQFQWNAGGLTFENWQVAHFRILANDKYYPYGSSILDSSRRVWRQACLLTDAMMAYRIVRSSERRVFYLYTGGIPENEVEQYVERTMTQMKKTIVANPTSGEADIRYNPHSVEEEYIVPFRSKETRSEIDQLPGGAFTGDIDDVEFLMEQLYAALRIPQEYLSRGKGESSDKQTLAQKDTRFARIIQRLQLAVISELKKIALIHLYTLGIRGEDLLKFELQLNNPSKIAEMQALESWRMKFEAAEAATSTGFFSKRWIATEMMGLTPKEHERNIIEQFFDKKIEARLEAMASMAERGTGDSFGGDLGALDDMADIAPEEGLEGDLPDEDAVLLATPESGGSAPSESPATAPGKRDEPSVRSKGKVYKPEMHDGRTSQGPRRRNMFGSFASEFASSTPRSMWKGKSDILHEIKELKRMQKETLEGLDLIEKQVINEYSMFDEEEMKILRLEENVTLAGEDVYQKHETQFVKYFMENFEQQFDKKGEADAASVINEIVKARERQDRIQGNVSNFAKVVEQAKKK